MPRQQEAAIAREAKPVSGKAKTGVVRKPAAKTGKGASEPAPEAAVAAKRAPAGAARPRPAAAGAEAKRVPRAKALPAAAKAVPAAAKAKRGAEPEAPAKRRSAAAEPKPEAVRKPRVAKAEAAKAAKATKPTQASKSAVTAGPAKTRRARKAKPTPELLDRMVEAAVKSLEDDKAEALVVLDVTGRASFADRMIVATGLAERQITAMAEHLDRALGEVGWKRTRVEASPDWVLIDAGDLIIHLFKPEARDAYAIERMWGPDSPAAEDS